jgi:hypothetical protein
MARARRANDGLGIWSPIARPIEMLGCHQPRDSHVHGRPSRGLTMSERCLAVNHGHSGVLLTLFAVRSRRHSYHSQADSAGSIPVTRFTRKSGCSSCSGEELLHCVKAAGYADGGCGLRAGIRPPAGPVRRRTGHRRLDP